MANKENIQNIINIVALILDAAGIKLSEKEQELLSSKQTIERLNNEQKNDLGNIYSNILKGYLSLAVNGYQFTNPDRIKERFGKSLEENYPEASKSFIKFAVSYWTFKIHLWWDFADELKTYLAYQLLGSLEFDIARIFFPMPGPFVEPSDEREKAQREILKNFDIDIEDFMRGNPILIRDRKRGV